MRSNSAGDMFSSFRAPSSARTFKQTAIKTDRKRLKKTFVRAIFPIRTSQTYSLQQVSFLNNSKQTTRYKACTSAFAQVLGLHSRHTPLQTRQTAEGLNAVTAWQASCQQTWVNLLVMSQLVVFSSFSTTSLSALSVSTFSHRLFNSFTTCSWIQGCWLKNIAPVS